MRGHVCGRFDHDKRTGCCICCQDPVYAVRAWWTEGPLEGHPRRLGPMDATGTQVTLWLSSGATADVTFCRACAGRLTPDAYRALWLACAARQDLALQLGGRSASVIAIARARFLRDWPVAVVGRRYEAEPGLLVVDRR